MRGVRAPATAILGIGLIAFSLHGSNAQVQAGTSSQRTVFVTTRAIGAGAVIDSNDLREVAMSGDAVDGVPATSRAIVGHRAAVNIGAGRLIEDSLFAVMPLADAAEQVTIHLEQQQQPRGLAMGDAVDVIASDPASGVPTVIAAHVIVASIGSGDGTGSSVTLDCPHDLALAIAGVQLNAKPLAIVRTAGH